MAKHGANVLSAHYETTLALNALLDVQRVEKSAFRTHMFCSVVNDGSDPFSTLLLPGPYLNLSFGSFLRLLDKGLDQPWADPSSDRNTVVG